MKFNDKPTEPIDINDANFDEAIKKYPIVLVDFWAPWCGPCKMIGPILNDLAKEYDGKVAILKLNIDDNRLVAGKFAIMSLPTLKLFKDGKEVDTFMGVMPVQILKSKIDPYL